MNELRVIPVHGVGAVGEGDDLVTLLLDALGAAGETLVHHDLVVVTSKVVSKSEGQVVAFDGTDEHKVALIERESVRVLRRRGTLRITETTHGFINANAGIDLSNTERGTAVLLPKDPDRSARRFRAEVRRRCDVEVAVVVSDTFGRTWRNGVTDVALGSAGLKPVLDLGGHRRRGRRGRQPGAGQGPGHAVRAAARARRLVLRRGFGRRGRRALGERRPLSLATRRPGARRPIATIRARRAAWHPPRT